MKLDEAINLAIKYYEGKKVPKTVSEYMQDYPKGLSRSVLSSKYNITAGKFLTFIGSSYTPMESTESKLLKLARSRNHKILSNTKGINKHSEILMVCSEGHTITTYWGSYSVCKTGCRACSGNLELRHRVEDLEKRAKELKVSIVRLPEGNQTDKITLKCSVCSSNYSCRIGRFISPVTDNEGSCPNCRASDTRVTYKGLTFGSQFEREAYKILESYGPKLQVRYSDYFSTSRQWTCDFVIGHYWIEVSSFNENSQGFSSYKENIDNKRALVESNNKTFVYLTSLREVRNFIDKI